MHAFVLTSFWLSLVTVFVYLLIAIGSEDPLQASKSVISFILGLGWVGWAAYLLWG